MRTIEATVVIDAPPSAVWDVLVTAENSAKWNPFTNEVSGPFQSKRLIRVCGSHLPVGSERCPSGHASSTPRPRGPALDWPAWTVGIVRRRARVSAGHYRGLRHAVEPARQRFKAMNGALRERAEARANRR